MNGRWEGTPEAFEETLRAASVVPAEATTLAVSLDGVMAPMRDGQRHAKRAEACGRRATQKDRPANGLRKRGAARVADQQAE